MAKSFYDSDLQQWIEQTVWQLRNREFEQLDIEHLIEELTDLGKAEKNALKSNLTILLAHLLKLTVQTDVPEMMKGSWYSSVLEHRQRVLNSLVDTPSLKRFLLEILPDAYTDARKLAVKESKLARFGIQVPSENAYPLTCPFSVEQILHEDFFGL
jgi:hypothetical protein